MQGCSRLETGNVSEDDWESDGDDLEVYPTREELLQVLECDLPTDDIDDSGAAVNHNDKVVDTSIIYDKNNIDAIPGNNVIPATSNATVNSRPLIWKKHSFQWDEEKIKFQNIPYPTHIMSLETPYQFFSYFFTDDFLESITQESNRYSVQKNPARPNTLTTIELRQYFGILIFMSVFRYPNALFRKCIEHALSKKKKGTNLPTIPPKEVRLDKVGHDQLRTDSRRRCQVPQCKLLSSIKCVKCNVYLC